MSDCNDKDAISSTPTGAANDSDSAVNTSSSSKLNKCEHLNLDSSVLLKAKEMLKSSDLKNTDSNCKVEVNIEFGCIEGAQYKVRYYLPPFIHPSFL